MLHRCVPAALLAALLVTAPQASAQQPAAALAQPGPALPEPARAAAVAVDAFHSALRRGDAKAALMLVADDALVFEEGRVERSKAEYALHHAGADAAFSKAVPAKRLRRTGGGTADLAWVATESRTKGRYNGADVDRIMVETMILRRDSGAWKIVHIHWSSALPATE
ncbi:MAG TPA: nuclear transport factor 2 family protein [Allosphingosinicella sp.]|jgi:ketosteroid isomerase-like protein